jgi:hypothetical protein
VEENIATLDPGSGSSGYLLWAKAGNHSIINGSDVLGRLAVGVYQVCVRPDASAAAAAVAEAYDLTASSFQSTGISMELQDVILGLWVNTTSHDGLHAVLFGSRGQDAFLRGR